MQSMVTQVPEVMKEMTTVASIFPLYLVCLVK